MTLTIELTPEQEEALEAEAAARGVELPELARLRLLETLPAATVPRRKTTAEILAGWDAEGLPSVYGRDPEDATVIARRLRLQFA